MKKNPFVYILAVALQTGALAGPEGGKFSPVQWEKLQLTDEFWAEGACVADVDKDGHNDILSGPFWYAGPAYKTRREIYPAKATFTMKSGEENITVPGFPGFKSGMNGYSDNFLSYAGDVDDDGWQDYIVVGFPGKETFWYKNPQGKPGQLWTRHLALQNTDNESPRYVDVTGDGRPELICMSNGTLGFAQPDPGSPTRPWKWNVVARNEAWKWNTHGLGFGDVNRDGKVDLLSAHHWWEQPEHWKEGDLWKQHHVIFNNGGSHMYAYDVDGDGLADVITAHEGHGYGLHCYQQTMGQSGRSWQKRVLMGETVADGETGVAFSQPHAIDLADINGDGHKDIITGKRVWAHGPDGDVEPNAPAVIYWFELVREKGKAKFVAHLIDDNSGVGTQVMATDVDKDGKTDVVASNKKGLFIHRQRSSMNDFPAYFG
ncbi:MAG: FG-GAP repeat domain-containing protein [Verrucomicrobiales bacterium]